MPPSSVLSLRPPAPPRRPVSLVVTGKYDSIFQPLAASAARLRFPFASRIIVMDGLDIHPPASWTFIMADPPFRMARNANLGWLFSAPGSDILYCGDDIRFHDPLTVERLQEVAYSSPRIGIVSPKLLGRSSVPMSEALGYISDIPPMGFWFPCIYLKRSVLDRVGYLDERFTSFCDDLDYSTRVLRAGLRLVQTCYTSVLHQDSASGSAPTFARNSHSPAVLDAMRTASYQAFAAKWGLSEDKFQLYARTGDISLLQEPSSDPIPDPPEPVPCP